MSTIATVPGFQALQRVKSAALSDGWPTMSEPHPLDDTYYYYVQALSQATRNDVTVKLIPSKAETATTLLHLNQSTDNIYKALYSTVLHCNLKKATAL